MYVYVCICVCVLLYNNLGKTIIFILYYNHLRLYTNLQSRLYVLKERDVPTCSLLFVSTLVHFTLRVNDEYIDIEEDKKKNPLKILKKNPNKAIPQTTTLQCLTFLDFTSCHLGTRPTGSGQTYYIKVAIIYLTLKVACSHIIVLKDFWVVRTSVCIS
jgi:hypothetical protein